MARPKKDYDDDKVGATVQINYEFLEHLWEEKVEWPRGADKKTQTLRQHLLSFDDEAALRTALEKEGISIEKPVGIVLVDIESATMKKFPPKLEATHDFYVLVLPPKLSRSREHSYMEAQAWRGAYYHALSDGYGM
jgi:hypothetical protein